MSLHRHNLSIVVKLLLTLAAAWLVAAICYLVTLVTLDHFFGVRQLADTWQAGYRGKIARDMVALLIDSTAITLPVIAAWGGIILFVTGSRYLARTILAIAAGISLLEAALLLFQFTPLQTLPFVAGFTVAMLFIRLLWCKGVQ